MNPVSLHSSHIRPVGRLPLYHAVALEIHDHILRNGLEPGDVLPVERDLMRRLNVSRASLREGMRVLQALGILRTSPGAGAIVYEPDLNLAMQLVLSGLSSKEREFLDLCEVREVLEVKAAELAAARAGMEEIKHLQEILALMEVRVARGEKPAEEDVTFHSGIFAASRNRVLNKLLEPIGNLLLAARRAGWLAPEQVLHEHRMILEAIAAHDRRRAAEAMRSHIRHSTETFLSAFIHTKGPVVAQPAPASEEKQQGT